MRIFQSVQNYCHTIGIQPAQAAPNGTFNWRMLWFLCTPTSYFASIMCSCVLRSVTFLDYTNCFAALLAAFASMIGFWAIIWKKEILFTFINEFEAFLQMSEFTSAPNLFQSEEEVCSFDCIKQFRSFSLFARIGEYARRSCNRIH